MAIYSNENSTKICAIKPSQIFSPSPKSRKISVRKYMAYTIYAKYFSLIYVKGSVYKLSYSDTSCSEIKILALHHWKFVEQISMYNEWI